MTEQPGSFCGYRCDLCPAFVDNVNILVDRTTLRKAWQKFFNLDIPEDRLICVGCKKTGRRLDSACPVRPCALQKHLQNCSFCELFESCDTLRLRADIINEIKKKHNGTLSAEDYKLYFRPYEGRKELTQHRKKRKSHGL